MFTLVDLLTIVLQESVAPPPKEDEKDRENDTEKPKSKKKKGKSPAADPVAPPTEAPAEAPAQPKPPVEKVEKEHSLYRRQSKFGVPPEEWDRRKSLNVCLRCGHPSHRIQECLLYGIIDGNKTWKDVPEYVEMNMEIPTVPKVRLSDKCGIPQYEWRRRREENVCLRCAHPGHPLKDCLLLKWEDFDGKKTWVDVPQYAEGMTFDEQGRPLPRAYTVNLGEKEPSPAPVSWDDAGNEKKDEKDKSAVEAEKIDAKTDTPKDTETPNGTETTPKQTEVVPTFGTDKEGYILLTPDGKLKKKILKEGTGDIIKEKSYVQCM